MSMPSSLTGQCSCGSISYTCTSAPKFTLICQCRQCQRITGTGHSPQFAVPAENTQIQGKARTFSFTSDAGNEVKSAFCETCGNPVYKQTAMMPDLFFFHAATLDDPGAFVPEMVVHAESSQPWDHIDPAIKRM